LLGKTRLQNDLLCVERDVKLFSLTHLLTNMGPNYKKHLTIILGYDNDLRYVVRQIYDKVKMSQDRFFVINLQQS